MLIPAGGGNSRPHAQPRARATSPTLRADDVVVHVAEPGQRNAAVKSQCPSIYPVRSAVSSECPYERFCAASTEELRDSDVGGEAQVDGQTHR